MSAPILDGPDREIQAIRMKLYRGQPLSKNEQLRWSSRMAVEKETTRAGGVVRDSAVPRTPSAREVGQQETQEARDYLQGRDDVLGRNSPQPAQPMSPTGQPMTRKSKITNDASDEEKYADNQLGNHMGEDGLPARWNLPAKITGSMNGKSITDTGNLPAGMGAVKGPDGDWRAAKGGKLTDERYATMEDIGNNNPIQGALGTQAVSPLGGAGGNWGPEADSAARGALPESRLSAGVPAGMPLPKRSVADDEQYIRQAGYGDFVDRARAPGATPAAAPPAAAPNMMAGRGGIMPMPLPRQAPQAPRAPAPVIAVPEAADNPPTPMVAAAPRAPAPVVSVPEGAANPVEAPQKMNRGVTTRKTPAAPMFPNAIWNSGLVPAGATWGGKPQQYQEAATQYNPFGSSDEERRRRRVGVLPE